MIDAVGHNNAIVIH